MLSGNTDEPTVLDAGLTEKAELDVTALPIEILGEFVDAPGRLKLKEAAGLVVLIEEVLFKLKEKLDAPVVALSTIFGGSLTVEGD